MNRKELKLREFSEAAWNIASRYSSVLASETRDLAAAIDDALRAQADSASTPAQASKGEYLDRIAFEQGIDAAHRAATPSPERTSDGVRTTFAGIADFIDTIRGPVLEALDQSKNRLEAIEEYRRGERAAIPTTKGTMETIKRARAALSSTPTDALPGTE